MPGSWYEWMDMSVALQIVLALVIVVVLYIITLIVLNVDSITAKKSHLVKPQESTLIVDGHAPVTYLAHKSYNTANPNAEDFMKLGKSINTIGGSQFTYQFWIKVEDPTDALFKDLVVLLKGDVRKYKMGLYDMNTQQLQKTVPPDYMIACPLIKFVDSYRSLRVQFNTQNSPMTYIDINMTPNEGGMSRRNALSLLPSSWYMFTFILEDNVSYANVQENGINFQFWLNDFPYQVNGASDTPKLRFNSLKQNDGDLFLFPSPPSSGSFMKLGNIKYYNYALEGGEIASAFRSGPPTKSAEVTPSGNDKPAYLSAYNKIDIYNY